MWEGGGAEEGKQVPFPDSHSPVGGGGGYSFSHIGMCRFKGYGFCTVLV